MERLSSGRVRIAGPIVAGGAEDAPGGHLGGMILKGLGVVVVAPRVIGEGPFSAHPVEVRHVGGSQGGNRVRAQPVNADVDDAGNLLRGNWNRAKQGGQQGGSWENEPGEGLFQRHDDVKLDSRTSRLPDWLAAPL